MPEESLESGTRAEVRRGRGRPKQESLTLDVLRDLLSKGWTQTKIAEEHGVSKQTVSVLAKELSDRKRTPKQAIEDNIPWPRMDSTYKSAATYERIAEYLKWVELGSETLSARQRERLTAFLNKLRDRNLVVVFDPDIPPDGHNRYGGWALLPRVESDGDLIIRLNEHTKIENREEAEEIWRMPDDRP